MKQYIIASGISEIPPLQYDFKKTTGSKFTIKKMLILACHPLSHHP